MISVPRATTSKKAHTQRYNHLQQIPQFGQGTQHLDVPRGWNPDLSSQNAVDILRAQADDTISIIPESLPATVGMHSDAWIGAVPQMPTGKMSRGRNHQRDSSASSMGSAEPHSPFNQSISNPQIAITTDFGSDNLDFATDTQPNDNYVVKPLGQYPGYHNIDPSIPDLTYPITLAGPGSLNRDNNGRMDRGALPAPELSNSSAQSQGTSSVGGNSPATPSATDFDTIEKRRKAAAAYSSVPKLNRTMTDIYSDELYNPNFAITSTSPPRQQPPVSPTNDVFSQRINAANNHHLNARQSPVISSPSRGHSPFRTASPLATSAQDFASTSADKNPHPAQFQAARRFREHADGRRDVPQPVKMENNTGADTPNTISPKDAILEFPESDENRNFPLFGTEHADSMENLTKPALQPDTAQRAPASFDYVMPQVSNMALQVPLQYPFVNQSNHGTPASLSTGTSSLGSEGSTPLSRPVSTAADGGTYTCTYHGCTLRFETPALLQKHKREGHRQTQTLGTQRVQDVGMTSTLIGSQAGPHRCNRINPSTGKPCNTVFSRPYDLTRHEDTIHNARKQKVNCDLCTEEKTFSRADALTRHYRVCHPEVEVPGKRRRS